MINQNSVMYMHFSESLQGSKSAITMRPVATESTLFLFLNRASLDILSISSDITHFFL